MKKLYLTCLSIILFAAFVHAQAPPPKFLNEIGIPPLVVNPDRYDLDVIQTVHDFNPHDTDNVSGLNGVTTFAFEDFNNPGTTTILGPTLVWEYKKNLTPSVLNRLTERTTCHWHGAHVPNFADGGPYQVIEPDGLWLPEFQVLDKSATMWYHPHAMDLTYKHVQMGLSGIIIVEDPIDDTGDPDDDILVQIHEILPTDYAVNDFPLVFQTKKFNVTDTVTGQQQIQSGFPGFKDGFEYMVNGIIDPYMNVPSDMIRLRMLNGDGKYSFNFHFDYANGLAFPAQMIATDAGYMDRSYELDAILMAPGERTEWLLDLRGLEGDTLYIKNMVSEIPSNMPCMSNQQGILGDSCTTNGWAYDRNLLKLIIGPPTGISSPIISFPIPLHPLETPPLSEVSNERTKVFRKDDFEIIKPNGTKDTTSLFNIDSTLMDMMVVNDVVMLGATEIWTIENNTEVAHPWHIHDIHFWVTEVIDENGTALDPFDYPEIFKGPKDNVLIQPGWTLSYIGTFEDFGVGDPTDPTNSYMYHCHILPHEDKGMMGTFVVFDPALNVEDSDLSSISMKVQPNPAQDVLYMHGASAKVSTLRFVDMSGRLVKEMTLPSFEGAIQIETNDLPNGMLIMDWQTVEGQATNKVMIHR